MMITIHKVLEVWQLMMFITALHGFCCWVWCFGDLLLLVKQNFGVFGLTDLSFLPVFWYSSNASGLFWFDNWRLDSSQNVFSNHYYHSGAFVSISSDVFRLFGRPVYRFVSPKTLIKFCFFFNKKYVEGAINDFTMHLIISQKFQ